MQTQPSYAHFFRELEPQQDVKVVPPRKTKSETDSQVCPCCNHDQDVALFTTNFKVYKHCNSCREAAIVEKDTKVRGWMEKESPFKLTSVIPLSRCWNCGRTNPMASDFPVDLNSPTGYGNYCLPKCKGRRPKP